MELINESWSKASAEMYSQSEGDDNEDPTNESSDENIDDVDFEEVSEEGDSK